MRPDKIVVTQSPRKNKKLRAELYYGEKVVNVDFGASGYSDFTIHKDTARKDRYDARHATNEDWKLSGINTAGFWAKWLLWNKPTLRGSATDTSRKFNIRILLR